MMGNQPPNRRSRADKPIGLKNKLKAWNEERSGTNKVKEETEKQPMFASIGAFKKKWAAVAGNALCLLT
jgi:hypothetical protein